MSEWIDGWIEACKYWQGNSSGQYGGAIVLKSSGLAELWSLTSSPLSFPGFPIGVASLAG
jgi:hypothetical protein